MACYKDMYFTLYRKVADVIEELQEVQRQTENMCISAEEPELRIVGGTDDQGNEQRGS